MLVICPFVVNQMTFDTYISEEAGNKQVKRSNAVLNRPLHSSVSIQCHILTFPPTSSDSLMQVAGDLDGLEQALGRKNPSEMFGSGSCSALLKLLPGNKDLLISHDTWGSYNSMLRLFKFYNLPFHRQQGTGMNRRNSGEGVGRGI